MAAIIAHAACQPHLSKRLSPSEFKPNYKPDIGITDVEQMEQALRRFCGVA